MADTRIYDIKSFRLDELIHDATNPAGALLLIPDLQRPYVWSPDQVVRLLDTLLRGWPFGTLLLWSVTDKEAAEIPPRTFWNVVDRTESEAGSRAVDKPQMAPATYKMVLDGQQRLQSLILAVGGDFHGFKLKDKEWAASLAASRRKSRQSKRWSTGNLCLDLPAFSAEFERLVEAGTADPIQAIDYTAVLKWVIGKTTEPTTSAESLPHNYESPLPRWEDHPGRFVRLHRLWQYAESGTKSDRAYREILDKKILPGHDIPVDLLPNYLEKLAELMRVLGDVKGMEVASLLLKGFKSENYQADDYNNAIVSIFTRLNSGGRALSDQEIAFAWIKRNWDVTKTGKRHADECFRELQEKLEESEISISIDELVRSLSAVWAVVENKGDLLGQKDLLRGQKVPAMAKWLNARWDLVETSFLSAAEILRSVDLQYGRDFESYNALLVLTTWRHLGAQWLAEPKGLTLPAKITTEAQLDEMFRQQLLRWLSLSQWAGVWASSGGRALEGYMRDLAKLSAEIAPLKDPEVMIALLEKLLTGWFWKLETEAKKYISGLHAERNTVYLYHLPLTVWGRLDPARLTQANRTLKISKRGRSKSHVDHLVSHGYWLERIANLPEDEKEELEEKINSLGNCSLLQSNFNMSKGKEPLGNFLLQIQDFKVGTGLADWASALAIPQALIHPQEETDLAAISAAIETRAESIRAALHLFIEGKSTASLASPIQVLDVSGEWESSHSASPTESLTSSLLVLQQKGQRVTGVYTGEDHEGTIEGTLDDHTLSGEWFEDGEPGVFQWEFTDHSFQGTWGDKRLSKTRIWTGRRKGK